MPLTPFLPPHPTNIFDFCQQCLCFHPAYYENNQLLMFPCQYAISQLSFDEKNTSDTNLTSYNTESRNSLSNLSIRNHFSLTVRPQSIKPKKKKYVIRLQQPFLRPQMHSSKSSQLYSPSKPPQRLTSIHSRQQSSSPKITQNRNQLSPIITTDPKLQQQKPLQFYNQPRSIQLVQTIPTSQSITTKNCIKPPLIIPKNLFPHLSINLQTPSHYQPTDTPQFGSESHISENKQNSLTPRRLLLKQQQKQFIIPKITQGNDQEDDYFCCGYIRRCDK